MASASRAASEASKRSANGEPQNTSNVIALLNLVSDEELDGSNEDYEDMFEDVEGECRAHAEVEKIEIPRSGVWRRTAFIQYSTREGAQKAVEQLRKREFNRQRINVEFVIGCSTASEALARGPVNTADE